LAPRRSILNLTKDHGRGILRISPVVGEFNNLVRAIRGVSEETQQGEAGAMPALIRNCIVWCIRHRAEPDYLPDSRPAPFVKEREDGMQTARIEPTGFDVSASSIHRSQERFFVFRRQLRRVTATGLMLVALCLSVLAAPVSAQDNQASVEKAIQWLQTQEQPDGGFAGFSGTSDPGATIDAIFAMVAAQSLGVNADTERAITYLGSNDIALVYAQTSAGSAAKLALALAATGNDPHNIDNVDPLSIVEAGAGVGMIGLGPYDHAIGILALVATGTPVPQLAIDTARDTQLADGSWSFDGTMTDGAGDTNTTAMMVQALVAAGVTSELVTEATDYLVAAQNEDGGFPYQPGAESDANSTALVIQAMIAANEENHADQLAKAQTALLGMQNESGAFYYMASTPDDNAFATVQAVPALAGVAYPLPVAMSVLATPPADLEATPAG
jgi:hypothetical protein